MKELRSAVKRPKIRTGRPPVDPATRQLIKDMVSANPLWGTPRIHGELLKLGFDISERTISDILKKARPAKSPSQTIRTFVQNHMDNTSSIDLFSVPTATFKILYVFIVLSNNRRTVVHFNGTKSPTALRRLGGLHHRYEWREAA